MYYLYFVKNGEFEFYGSGNMDYIVELLNDYLSSCKMYEKESVEFKVTSKII